MIILQLVSSSSRLIPSIVALLMLKKTTIPIKIFSFILWLGTINELISSVLIYKFSITPMYNINIYVLIESVLLLIFFERLRVFNNNKQLFFLLISLFIITWGAEMFLVSNLSVFSEYFITFYSIVIALVALKHINSLIKYEQVSLLRSPSFIICIGVIIFYTYSTFVQVYFLKPLKIESNLKYKIYDILLYINIIANLIFTFGYVVIKQKSRHFPTF